MKQTNQDRAIIPVLERLKQEWAWLEHIYIVQGSPLEPKQYKSIAVDTRQSELLRNVTLESTVQKWLDYKQAAVWIEAIELHAENSTNLSVWIIGKGPRESIDGRIFRKGVVKVHFDGSKASAESLARLETRFTPFLIPPSGKRVGCSPLFSDSPWFWLSNRDLWIITTESEKFHYHELRIERGTVREVRSAPAETQYFSAIFKSAIRFSPKAQYLSWPEFRGGKQWRGIQSVKSNRPISRIALSAEQFASYHEWIDDMQWVEYRGEEDDFIVDTYDVHHTEKIRSQRYPGLNTSDALQHIGFSEKGELALVAGGTGKGKVQIHFIDLRRSQMRTTIVPVPENEYAAGIEMAPNGKWISWHIPGNEFDPFFNRGAVWVSRVDGSHAHLVTEFVDVKSGYLHSDGLRQFEWRRDSAALADNWGDCLYSFPL